VTTVGVAIAVAGSSAEGGEMRVAICSKTSIAQIATERAADAYAPSFANVPTPVTELSSSRLFKPTASSGEKQRSRATGMAA
jgi:hypothetical protein